MSETNSGRITAVAVVVVGAVIAIGAAVWLLRGPGGPTPFDVESDVVLETVNGVCVVQTKAGSVSVKKDKFVTWNIDNRCGARELVTVGNFRTAGGTTTATDCLGAIEGATWPFQESESDLSKRQHQNQIKLKVKKDADLPGGRIEYDFDICTGPDAERKSDPRLVIER